MKPQKPRKSKRALATRLYYENLWAEGWLPCPQPYRVEVIRLRPMLEQLGIVKRDTKSRVFVNVPVGRLEEAIAECGGDPRPKTYLQLMLANGWQWCPTPYRAWVRRHQTELKQLGVLKCPGTGLLMKSDFVADLEANWN